MPTYPPRLILSSGLLTAELLPDWGSKMISFRTERDGYDFLAPAPAGPHRPDPAVYAPQDAYGFDEMFPGVHPQPYPAATRPGTWISDHGDLWYRAWEWSGSGAAAVLSVADDAVGWYFQKRVHFTEPLTLSIDYRVENRSDDPLPWLYSAHILCPYHEGVELEIPAGSYNRLETMGQPLPETCQAEAAHLRQREAFPPQSAAFYMSQKVGAAACVYRDRQAGKALRLSWSEPLAYLGLWYNSGGWLDSLPLTHLGLEPTNAGHQNLAEWLKTGLAHPLLPGEHATWTLTMAVEGERP